MHLMGLYAAVRATQFHHHAPVHATLTFRQPADIIANGGGRSGSRDRRLSSRQTKAHFRATQSTASSRWAGWGPPTFWTVSCYDFEPFVSSGPPARSVHHGCLSDILLLL